MNLLNIFTEARKYFEVIAAYNIDRFRFQSMVSTAHKLASLQQAMDAHLPMDEISKGAASVSTYWYYKVLHSPIFKEQHDLFKGVEAWVTTHGMTFNVEADSFNTDVYCNHMLVNNPHSGGYEVFDLSTGNHYAVATLPVRSALSASVITVQDKTVPLYNFTRRECGAKSHVFIGHQATH